MESVDRKFLLVTANIGSLFEEHGRQLRKKWIESFHKLVAIEKPLFIGVHLQEVGGKADVQLKDEIESYFREIVNCDSFTDYTCNCSYVDEETGDHTKYTALGCSYFVHKSLKTVEQWNFNLNCFSPISRKHQLFGITDDIGTIRKIKFPLSCYSKKATRLPRKGFTWTRWRIYNKVFDLLNIHLTHDACNVNCTLKSPTKYSKHRRRALEFVIDRLREFVSDHQILFGDFNVRPDTKALVEHLMENIASQQLLRDSEGKPYSVIYKSLNGSSLDLLKIESRFFEMSDYDAFNIEKVPNLIRFDNELQWVKDELHYKELPITFQPTYPHKENPEEEGTTFANVRCPSWCDRIILDSNLFNECVQNSDASYDSFGKDVCVGDHKPVFLSFNYPGLLADQ